MKAANPVGLMMVLVLLAGCGGGSSQAEMGAVETATETEGGGGDMGGDSGGDPMVVHTGVDLSGEDQQTVADFDELMSSWDAQMQNDPSGCGAACDLKDRVCDLSERICTIADRHPRDTRLSSRCTDGRDRCQRAGNAVERCGCDG